MKKVEIAVCDDEYIHVERIVKYIGVYSEECEIDINVTEYNSGKLLLEAVEGDTSKYDIIFLDVEMRILMVWIQQEVSVKFQKM